jgi:antitoxin component HigA of HigAB toxin-antitoxin module
MTLPESNSLRANIRINVDEAYEVKHWARQLGVSIERLRAVIAQVGPLVDVVRLHLKDEMHPDNPWYPRGERTEVNR